ncbi:MULTISPECIES: hypothetical protein [Aeromicrobium]|uniref:hypothetical protein n=1 Tax=Aeromicrobium TaxID=2040 RepID=UPI0006F4BEA7|nr:MULTISPECIES: hypothetical protein [Aeromicrobium]KQX75460.1 hypothetical protein ASD10_09915 [Aeromicrobium sp. Root472D3]MBD8605950.1 hypothetical protein [Aeromicrobium sp. CFBP 8757]MCL8252138.1 hypothetical protein [Aeromicrobium fastidiosum]
MPSVEYDATPREVRSFALLQIVLTGVFLVLLFFMLGATDQPFPPIWLTVVLLALVAAGAFLAERVWLSASPLPAAGDPADTQREAVGIFAAQTVRKLIYAETPLLVAVVVSFVTDHGGWPIVVAGFPGMLVLTWEVWPSPRNTSLSAAMLDSQGAESRLVESFLEV